MTRTPKLATVILLAVVSATTLLAQTWDRVGGSMQTRGSTTTPLVVIDQVGTGKALSIRDNGTEVWAVDAAGQSRAPIGCEDGLVGWAFVGDTDSGLCRPEPGELELVVDGYPMLNVQDQGTSQPVWYLQQNVTALGANLETLAFVGGNTNPFVIGTTAAGSGTVLGWTARGSAAVAKGWTFQPGAGGSHFVPEVDGELTIGQVSPSVLRPSHGYFAGLVSAATFLTGAGSTSIAPLTVTNGTNLTTPTANSVENDGTRRYWTQDTTNGRSVDDNWNYFRLTASGSGITTIADFFGATGSGIPLVANGVYEIEWHARFSQATAGIATWTIVTATTALANLSGEYTCTNIAGIGAVGAPQSAGINVTSSSSTAFPVTGTMANAATHVCNIKVVATAGNGASNTRLRLTMSAGTATPLINSYFKVRRLPSGNVGTFAS